MGYFSGQVDLRNAPGGSPEQWIVDAELSYAADSGDLITIHEGAPTDGASIPRIFWRLIGPPIGDRYTAAAIVHDVLYRTCGHTGTYSRADCDALFHEMLLVLGIPNWKAWLMWCGVRVGGATGFECRWHKVKPSLAGIDVEPASETEARA